MNIIGIIGIIAGSITIIGFLFVLYRKIGKTIKNVSERIDNLELSLNSKQKFILPKGTKINISDSNRIIIIDRDEEIIIDKIEKDIISGKIYSNSLSVMVPFTSLGKEIK